MGRKSLDSKIINVLFHLVAWFCFLVFPFILGVPLVEDIFVRIFFHTAFLAIFFYLNIYFLIPQLLTRGRIAWYFITVLLILALIVGVNLSFYHFFEFDYKTLHEHFHAPNRPPRGHNSLRAISRPLFSAIFIFAVSTSYRLLFDYFRNERKKKEAENEKLVSELSFLKSQVSPHFLFNTLNNIYSLSLNNSELASEAILKLSQLLRYMLYESDVRQVPLDKEIDYLNTYIDLQKMRLREDVVIGFHKEGNFKTQVIEPMLLIPFVENAFKHGVSYSSPSEIKIDIQCRDNKLRMVVENSIAQRVQSKPNESGIGLSNVNRRLNLLYPGQFNLKTEEKENRYLVELDLILKK